MAKTLKKPSVDLDDQILTLETQSADLENTVEMMDSSQNHRGNTLGDILRTARESQKLSLQEVSSSLRLSIKQIEALENNRFSELPGLTTTRGFIRNYARFLKLAAEPLLEHYRVAVPTQVAPSIVVATSLDARSVHPRKFSLGLILLSSLFLIALVFAFTTIKSLQPIASVSSVTNIDAILKKTETQAESLPEIALPAAERMTSTQLPSQDQPLENSLSNTVTEGSADTQIQSTSQTLDASSSPQTQNAEKNISNNLNFQNTQPSVSQVNIDSQPLSTSMNAYPTMSFAANQDTWLQVVDADGKQVLSEIIAGGSEKKLEAKLPLQVVVGNKNGGILKFNGVVVDMAPYGGKDVAKLTLR